MLTATLILAGGITLIAIQPSLMRWFSQWDWRQRETWVEFWQPEETAKRWQQPVPKRENAFVRWWNTPSPLGTMSKALAANAKATQKLLGDVKTVWHDIQSFHEDAPQSASTEVWIDGTTGKRIVPEHLGEYEKQQQLRDMEMQIRQHDQAMARAWKMMDMYHPFSETVYDPRTRAYVAGDERATELDLQAQLGNYKDRTGNLKASLF